MPSPYISTVTEITGKNGNMESIDHTFNIQHTFLEIKDYIKQYEYRFKSVPCMGRSGWILFTRVFRFMGRLTSMAFIYRKTSVKYVLIFLNINLS